MLKKLTLLAMAVAALAALVAPAGASASHLTMPAGVLVPEGHGITVTNDPSDQITITTAFGTVFCKEILIPGEVTKNSNAAFAVRSIARGLLKGCETDGGTPVTVTMPRFTFKSAATGTSDIGVTFILHFEFPDGPVTCHYQTPEEETTGVFHYTLGSSTFTLTETELESPLCGEGAIHGSTHSLRHRPRKVSAL